MVVQAATVTSPSTGADARQQPVLPEAVVRVPVSSSPTQCWFELRDAGASVLVRVVTSGSFELTHSVRSRLTFSPGQFRCGQTWSSAAFGSVKSICQHGLHARLG
ncbi:hypothetical protein Hdeb2414_s0108g00796861 [Helianthus debilis subsp. tardiflorus]